jgi:hypothetical protein
MGLMNRYVVAAAAAIAVLAVAAALAFALRGGGDSASSAGPVPSVSGTTSVPTASTTATAPCSPRTFLAVLREGLLPTGDQGQIARAEVIDCRNDYARVNAIPDKSNCPPHCYEGAMVYLQWTGDSWRILDYGSGIECEDTTTLPPLPGPVRRACLALGYPQPAILTTRAFRMPSRNIGCALTGGDLRCDILSGLKPEPDRGCELDWVGLVLPAAGAPEPLCAGDTIYDQSAPILAYGAMWHGAQIWCESQKTGLDCINRTGGSFRLAREGWEGG